LNHKQVKDELGWAGFTCSTTSPQATAATDALCYARDLVPLRLADISGPFVLIHGTADTIVKPRVAEAAHQLLPGSQLRWETGDGHFMLSAHPELLLDRVAPASAQA
jgi:pimeloyl-ACP methyl ester carboxylesterase